MIKNNSNYFFDILSTAFPLFILFLLFFVRSYLGVNLQDEIQYYYQIIGLVDNDKPFSNDLYIQQLIYLIFYPIFKPYYYVFGESGLILYGRIVFSILLFVIYEFSRRQFLAVGCKKLDAGLCAVALVLVLPYHGIYGLSYNTVSQICWVCTVLFVLFRMSIPIWVWSVLIIISIIAHPIGGFAIGAICIYHHLSSSLTAKSINIILLSTVLGILCFGFIALSVGIDTLLKTLNFTRGFSVGVAVLKSTQVLQMLLIALFILFATLIDAKRKFARYVIAASIFLFLIFEFYILYLSVSSSNETYWPSSYNKQILGFWVLICCISIYAYRCIAQNNYESDYKLSGLITLLSIQAVTLSGTSSNGIIQAVGAFSMFVPIINALIIQNAYSQKTLGLSRTLTFLVALSVCSISIFLPYGQDSLYRHDRRSSSLPLFSGLYLPEDQLAFFENVKEHIGPFANRKEGLIFSKIPAIYSILDVKPSTCMIYNHSLGSNLAEDILLECMLKKKINLIIKVGEWRAADDRVRNLIEEVSLKNELVCVNHKALSVLEKYGGSNNLHFEVCTQKN